MKKEQDSNLNNEERTSQLIDQLVDQLNANVTYGKEHNIHVDYRTVRLVQDTDLDGYISLYLLNDGEWYVRTGMEMWPIGEPSLEKLLEKYSIVTDPESRPMLSEDFAAAAGLTEEEFKTKKPEYMAENRARLLQEFTGALESKLQYISSDEYLSWRPEPVTKSSEWGNSNI